jgi:hypothetical protein
LVPSSIKYKVTPPSARGISAAPARSDGGWWHFIEEFPANPQHCQHILEHESSSLAFLLLVWK